MADKRKLQGEIDRCLKKVNEGVEAFDDIWQKVQAASNSNQKEKYEADLKKEIKKLQRLRDQIKTWAASNDIKDKRPLLDARKLIETQMERFKVVERETKTKAYSKEGLGQANKIDPITKEKEECREWLNESIDRIKLQIDQMESEIESMQSGNKKKKIDREKTGKIEAHRERIEKHRFHIKSLELILRLLDNESLEVDRVNKLKEDVDYYIENCQEPDFVDDEGLYEEFDLESDLALSAELVRSPSETNRDDDDIDIPSPGSSVSSSSGYMIGMANSPSSKSITNANSPRKSKSSSTSSSNGSSINIVNNNSTTITTTSVTTTTSSNTRSKSFSTPTTTMATIATTITSIAPSSSPPPSSSLVLESTTTISTVAPALTALTTNHNSVNNKVSSISPSSKAVGQPTVTPYAVAAGANQPSLISVQKSSGNQQVCLPSPPLQTQPSLSQISTSSVLTNHVDSHQYPALSTTRSNELKLSDGLNSLVQSEILSVSQSSSPVSLPPSSTNQSESISDTTVTSSLTDVTTLPAVSTISSIQSGVSIPSSLTSISSSLSSSLSMTQNAPESITLKSISGSTDQIQIPTDYGTKSIMPVGGIYDGSSQSPVQGTTKPAPQTQEVHLQPLLGVAPLGHVPLVRERMNQLNMLEAAFHHLPQRQDSERMKPYLPRNAVPIASYHHHQPPPHIDSLEFFQRLATETLFFIFYYQEGTRAQYLAAKALKKQSWRFHTKYMMWFQRHEEPKTITDEYEQGTYIFFDFEKWSQRKREGFTFEYRYLEDKELP